ncbi:MAG: T9SS type A sorting domain-containing protein [Daejeonella sp.]
MKKGYLPLFNVVLILSLLAWSSITYANRVVSDTDSIKNKAKGYTKITDTRFPKSQEFSSGVILSFIPFKPNPVKASNNSPSVKPLITVVDDKILNNVRVYPNPVSDQLNLSYRINKDSNVTIKLMDVLGNEITTLFSQKMFAGEQNNSFNIASRLNTGYYFVRIIAGNEAIIKRISVL